MNALISSEMRPMLLFRGYTMNSRTPLEPANQRIFHIPHQ
jgi:hypothetical protein